MQTNNRGVVSLESNSSMQQRSTRTPRSGATTHALCTPNRYTSQMRTSHRRHACCWYIRDVQQWLAGLRRIGLAALNDDRDELGVLRPVGLAAHRQQQRAGEAGVRHDDDDVLLDVVEHKAQELLGAVDLNVEALP